MKLFISLFFALLTTPFLCNSQIMNNNLSFTEVLSIGVNNDNYLGVNYRYDDRLTFFFDHTFYTEKINYQRYDFGINYKILNRERFSFNLQSSAFGTHLNFKPLFYISPEFFFKSKYFQTKFKLDIGKNFFQEPKWNLNIFVNISKITINNYVKQSTHSYYRSIDHKLIGSELLYIQGNLLIRGGFEIPDDLNKKFIHFKIGTIISLRNKLSQ